MHELRQSDHKATFHRLWRVLGWVFIVLGGLLTAVGVWQITDATSVIRFNGALTTATGPKLLFTFIGAAFAIGGVIALALPARLLDRMYSWWEVRLPSRR